MWTGITLWIMIIALAIARPMVTEGGFLGFAFFILVLYYAVTLITSDVKPYGVYCLCKGDLKALKVWKWKMDEECQGLISLVQTQGMEEQFEMDLDEMALDVEQMTREKAAAVPVDDGLDKYRNMITAEIPKHAVVNAMRMNGSMGSLTVNYRLTKGDVYVIDPAIQQLKVGLKWDASSGGKKVDVDASVMILNMVNDRFTFTEEAIVSYKNLKYKDAVVHAGDNLTGLRTIHFYTFWSWLRMTQWRDVLLQ